MPQLDALVLGCTLKPGPGRSSSEKLGEEVLAALADHGVSGKQIRVVDAGVKFGVTTDEGGGDGWPAIREQILHSQILVLAVPIWMGQPSSVCKMVLERLDAELAETDAEGRMLTYGKVAAVAVVGNEDGAHHVTAEVMQGLNDVGFTIPAAAATYWVGAAMQTTDYVDAKETTNTASATKTLAANVAHTARLLADNPYPPS